MKSLKADTEIDLLARSCSLVAEYPDPADRFGARGRSSSQRDSQSNDRSSTVESQAIEALEVSLSPHLPSTVVAVE
jgi:hypothetical protein